MWDSFNAKSSTRILSSWFDVAGKTACVMTDLSFARVIVDDIVLVVKHSIRLLRKAYEYTAGYCQHRQMFLNKDNWQIETRKWQRKQEKMQQR